VSAVVAVVFSQLSASP